jgi:hypothetical protein
MCGIIRISCKALTEANLENRKSSTDLAYVMPHSVVSWFLLSSDDIYH